MTDENREFSSVNFDLEAAASAKGYLGAGGSTRSKLNFSGP